MPNLTLRDRLLAAADRVERAPVQGYYAADAEGICCQPYDEQASRWCVLGAMWAESIQGEDEILEDYLKGRWPYAENFVVHHFDNLPPDQCGAVGAYWLRRIAETVDG